MTRAEKLVAIQTATKVRNAAIKALGTIGLNETLSDVLQDGQAVVDMTNKIVLANHGGIIVNYSVETADLDMVKE